jgi:hypothetical protein
MAKSDESSTIRRSIEFAIAYDEPVCDACGSKLITHSFDGRGWKFWCSAEIDNRTTRSEVCRWQQNQTTTTRQRRGQ